MAAPEREQECKNSSKNSATATNRGKNLTGELGRPFFPISISLPVDSDGFSLVKNPLHTRNKQHGNCKEGNGCSGSSRKEAHSQRRLHETPHPQPRSGCRGGFHPLPRTEIISKLWVYIKANKLQDAANKRMINADAKLKEVFGKPQVSMFEMAGLIGKHVK